MTRAPVNTNLGNPELAQTVARPRGISAPVATVGEQPGMALARSLAAMRPELNDHLESIKQWGIEDDTNRAYDTIQGMTHAEAKAAVDAGTMRGTESPWFRAAFQKQFGLAHAADRRRQIVSDYNNTFDKDGGDLDSFLKGYVQEDLAAYGDSEFVLSGIREGMGNTLGTIRDQHAQYRDTQLQARTVEQFYTVAGGAVDQAVESGGDVNAALGSIYADHGSALGLTSDQMDAQALALAARYASEGNLEGVEAIMNADPAGLGAFSGRSAYALKAAELTDLAKANAGKTQRTRNFDAVTNLETRAASGLLDERDMTELETYVAAGSMSAGERENLVGSNKRAQTAGAGEAFALNVQSEAMTQATTALLSGRAAIVGDQQVVNPYTGATITINSEDLIDSVVTEQIGALEAANATPQTIAAQLGSWGVPTTYAPWENLMTNGANAVSTQLATLGPDGLTKLPEPAVLGYTLFRALQGQRQVRDMHVKDGGVAALYRDAELLETHGALTPEEALLASSRIDRKSGRTNLSTALERDKFNQMAKRVTSGGLFEGEAENSGMAIQALEGLTRINMDLGLPMQAAIDAAAEDVEATYENLGGVLVNVRDKFIPPNFQEIAAIAVEDYAQTQGRDADEFRLWPVDGQDFWIIQEQGSMQPALGARPIHISKLQKNPRAYSMVTANEEISANR